jgi:hypothetical protein
VASYDGDRLAHRSLAPGSECVAATPAAAVRGRWHEPFRVGVLVWNIHSARPTTCSSLGTFYFAATTGSSEHLPFTLHVQLPLHSSQQ